MHDQLGKLPTRRHSIISKIKRTVFSQRFQLIKNPDVFHATKSLPLLFKNKNNQKQSGKSKQNNVKLFMYKIIKSKENKIVPTPENPSI